MCAMSFVDTTMAGQASARDLAAIAVGGSLWMPATLLLRGVLMALTPVIAHHRGANKLADIPADLRQTLWIALLFSILIIAFLNMSEPIMAFMNVAPDIIPIAAGYLHALSFGMLGFSLFYTLNSFCEGMGDTRTPMLISVAGLLVNIPTNYILIYGKLGMPELGAVGCGWATAIVYLFMSILLGLYLRFGPRHYQLLSQKSPRLPVLPRIITLLKLGLPIGITIFIEGSIFAMIALLIGKLGASTVASHQIALSFSGLAFMVPLSISFGITIRVGHALGAGDPEEARMRTFAGTLLAVFWAALSAVLILLFPKLIIGLYTRDAAVAQGATLLLTYAAMYQISDALQASANGALRGYKDTRAPMILVSISYWVIALPLGYILGLSDLLTAKPMGPAGFWIGLVTGLSCAALLLGGRLAMVIRKQGRTVTATTATP